MLGGLFNISFGNTAELILALFVPPGACSDRLGADHRIYAANLIYALVTHRDMFGGDAPSG